MCSVHILPLAAETDDTISSCQETSIDGQYFAENETRQSIVQKTT